MTLLCGKISEKFLRRKSYMSECCMTATIIFSILYIDITVPGCGKHDHFNST